MRSTKLIVLLAAPLFLTPVAGAEPTEKKTPTIQSDDHPASVLEHYKWCLDVKDLKTQTARLRNFWEEHCPIDGAYDDSIHGRMVLLSAYKLVENYSRMNRSDDAALLLNWIRSEDDRLMEEERKSAEKALPIEGEAFTVAGRTAFLIPPEKSKSDDLIPWVWYAPTLPRLPGKEEVWMFEQFLANGIAIAGIDVGESFGNPKGRAIYSALHKELVENRGMARQACLLARSRGGLMLYNWAVEHPDSVACIAGIYPVCNLSSYPGLSRACGAYGMTEELLAEKLAENNPIDRLAPLAKAKIPVFHIHGDSDKVVPLAKNSALLKKRYDQFGGEMILEIVEGQGHNMWSGWFQSQALVDFMIANAEKK